MDGMRALFRRVISSVSMNVIFLFERKITKAGLASEKRKMQRVYGQK